MKEKTLDLLMEETPGGVSRVAAGTPIVLVQCLLDVENTGTLPLWYQSQRISFISKRLGFSISLL
jgi:hypothetical protein